MEVSAPLTAPLPGTPTMTDDAVLLTRDAFERFWFPLLRR